MNERTNGQRNVTYTVTKNKENHDANELSNNTITVTSFISSFFFVFFFSSRCIVERKTCLSINDPCNQYYCGKEPAGYLKMLSF